MIAGLLLAAVVFGGADQYLGSLPALPWGASASLLSAPWLLVAFVAGWTQRDTRRGMLLGLLCTYAALLGYALMTLSPVEGAQLTWTTAVGFARSEMPVIVGGLVTGPLFGWFGHRWHVARAWIGALVTAAAFCAEPLAESAVRPYLITSTLVRRAEIAAGIAMIGYVVLTAARHRPRNPI
jgi:Family of unknown function (DUF6518)